MKLSLLIIDWQLSQHLSKEEGDKLRKRGWQIWTLLNHDLDDLDLAIRYDIERRYPQLCPFECEDPFEGRRVAFVVPGHLRLKELLDFKFQVTRFLPEDETRLRQAIKDLLVPAVEPALVPA